MFKASSNFTVPPASRVVLPPALILVPSRVKSLAAVTLTSPVPEVIFTPVRVVLVPSLILAPALASTSGLPLGAIVMSKPPVPIVADVLVVLLAASKLTLPASDAMSTLLFAVISVPTNRASPLVTMVTSPPASSEPTRAVVLVSFSSFMRMSWKMLTSFFLPSRFTSTRVDVARVVLLSLLVSCAAWKSSVCAPMTMSFPAAILVPIRRVSSEVIETMLPPAL